MSREDKYKLALALTVGTLITSFGVLIFFAMLESV